MPLNRAIVTVIILIAAGSVATGCGGSTGSRSVARKSFRRTPYAGGSAATPPRENSSESVATVGAETITRGALQHWIAIGTHELFGAPEPPDYTACIEYLRAPGTSLAPQTTNRLRAACRSQYDELLKPALSSLIHARWLLGEASDEGLKVDKGRLAHDSSTSGPRGGEVRQALRSTGETTADLRFKLRTSQLSSEISRRLEREVPKVTHVRIAEYYELHKKRFVVPEMRDLYILRTSSAAAGKRARGEIERGASFATVVGRTSLEQPVAARRGLLIGLGPHQFGEPVLNTAIFGAPLKALVGPVAISLGYYVFEVLRSVPPHQKTLAEAAPEIAKELHQTQRDRIFSRFVHFFRKKWRSKTNCLRGYIVKYCRQFRPSKTEPHEDPTVL